MADDYFDITHEVALKTCSSLRELEQACYVTERLDRERLVSALKECQQNLVSLVEKGLDIKDRRACDKALLLDDVLVGTETAVSLLGISLSSWKRYVKKLTISNEGVRHSKCLYSLRTIQRHVWEGRVFRDELCRENALDKIQKFIERKINYLEKNPQINNNL